MSGQHFYNSPTTQINKCGTPQFKGYQLLGDSNMVRFAIRHSPDARHLDSLTTRRIGLCVSGMRAEGLLELVEAERHNLHPRVLVLIGTNDVLHCSRRSTMGVEFNKVLHTMERLRSILDNYCEEVVFLTIPPIPCREAEGNLQYFKMYQAINRDIITNSTGDNLRNLSLHLEFGTSRGYACTSLFEKTMGSGLGQRPDGIHLNKEGHSVMAEFLMEAL